MVFVVERKLRTNPSPSSSIGIAIIYTDAVLQVTRYLEFKTVDGSYVVKGGKVNKVRQRGRGRGAN